MWGNSFSVSLLLKTKWKAFINGFSKSVVKISHCKGSFVKFWYALKFSFKCENSCFYPIWALLFIIINTDGINLNIMQL